MRGKSHMLTKIGLYVGSRTSPTTSLIVLIMKSGNVHGIFTLLVMTPRVRMGVGWVQNARSLAN
uniref:Uncharacterized protein n=1 Tax=Arundo donax TaxID=35708 RepID=A0A0A8XV05_ARUDO